MEVTKTCELCGKIFDKGLSPSHLTRKHEVAVDDYQLQFGRITFPWTNGKLVKCVSCGKEIYIEQNQIDRCSKHKCSICYEKSKLPVKATCATCGKKFDVKRSKIVKYNNCNIYCSDTCRRQKRGSLISASKKIHAGITGKQTAERWKDPLQRSKMLQGLIAASKARKTGRIIICAFCGKEEYKSACFVRMNKTGKFYCSDPCRDQDRAKTSVYVNCYICSQPIRKWHYQIESNDSKLFAHKRCISKRSDERSDYGPEWCKKLKAFIRDRDTHLCQDCGKTEAENGMALDVHHKDKNKRNNIADNLISLCRCCHMKRHPESQRFL